MKKKGKVIKNSLIGGVKKVLVYCRFKMFSMIRYEPILRKAR